MVAYTIRRSDGMGERLIECQWWISGAECVNDGLWRREGEEGALSASIRSRAGLLAGMQDRFASMCVW